MAKELEGKIVLFQFGETGGILSGEKGSGKVVEEHQTYCIVESGSGTVEVKKSEIKKVKTQAESVYGNNDCCGAYSSEYCNC